MAPSSGIWAPIAMNVLKNAIKKTSNIIKKRLAEAAQRAGTATAEPIPILVRNTPRQPINKAAWLRQSKGRWYTTHSTANAAVRRFMSTAPSATRFTRAAFPTSAIGTTIHRSTARAPFSSTLRPNLTGGAFPRTAGGYSLGGTRAGGARHFSHTPAAPAQVVHNVSAAVRAFWLSGHTAQFDGVTARGDKRFRTVSAQRAATRRTLSAAKQSFPGSSVDFHFRPTVTALSPLSATLPPPAAAPTLHTDGFLDVLAVDFARALTDLAAITTDLRRLAALGDLAVTLEPGAVLRVRFPGCDAESVERLCAEVGVQRGVVRQDAGFDDSCGAGVALRFPFASTAGKPRESPAGSLPYSQTGLEYEEIEEYEGMEEVVEDPWLASPEGYASMEELSETESVYFGRADDPGRCGGREDAEYVQGIYRFLEGCDGARRL